MRSSSWQASDGHPTGSTAHVASRSSIRSGGRPFLPSSRGGLRLLHVKIALIALLLVVRGAIASADDGKCIELHCICPGGEQVGSCDTTCEVLCGTSSSSPSSSTPPGPPPIFKL